ncbi:hypothetical protein CPLU01_12915 [Colletotrichum plurivorum]|uniref:Uncharacterized protein n=1 Tax=Colletotrichum plurivorum TaxID=2175906 RepID=A0A8H6N553_9PEZI|nr:hypothetical protein CPLU01_12915 [Colletotrichum plurivorum]
MELWENIIASHRLTTNDGAEDEATQHAENLFPSSSFFDHTMPEDWWQLQIQSADAHEPYVLEEDFDMNNDFDMFQFPGDCQPDAQGTLESQFFNYPIAAEASIDPSLLQATNTEPQPLSEMAQFVSWPEVPQSCCQLIDFGPMEIETPTEVQTQLPRSPEQTQILLLRMQALQGAADTQDLLANLRPEAEKVCSGHSPRVTSDPFYGNMLCHLDVQKAHYFQFEYSSTKRAIYIERPPATTPTSGRTHNAPVVPVMDSFQMSSFAADRCPRHLISRLSDQDLIISNAWKSAYWIKVLFDWNRHQLFIDQYTTLGREHPVNLQSLTIEFMYSVSYIVKKVMDSLWQKVTRSLGGGPDADQSPWTLSHALLILCNVIKSSKNESSHHDVKDIPHIGKFMSSLRSTTEPMLRALQHYRWEAARRCCWQANPNQALFDSLLETAKAMKSNLAISFEHQPAFVSPFNRRTAGIRKMLYSFDMQMGSPPTAPRMHTKEKRTATVAGEKRPKAVRQPGDDNVQRGKPKAAAATVPRVHVKRKAAEAGDNRPSRRRGALDRLVAVQDGVVGGW